MRFVVVWILEGMTASLFASFETQEEANDFCWQKILADDEDKIECIDVIEKGKPLIMTIGQ